MYKFSVFLIVFAIYLENCNCASYGRSASSGTSSGGRTYVGRRNSYLGGGGPITTTTTTSTTPATLTAKEYLQKHGTFSAWSLILVITCVILIGLAFYYCILCYPILFRTEKNYRFMDASSTTTSRSIQSGIDNFPEKQIDDFVHQDDHNNINQKH